METIFDFLVSLVCLAGYCYSLIYAHVLLARIDKRMRIPRHISGEIRLKEIKDWALLEFKDVEPDIKKAIMLLNLSNYIVYAYIGLFIYSILSGNNYYSGSQSAFTKIIHL